MKISKRDVMKYAWELRREKGVSMSVALKASWAFYKCEAQAEEEGKECGWNYKVIVNDWAKGGHDRTYIALRTYTNAWNAKRDYKYGYVNNLTGEFVAA